MEISDEVPPPPQMELKITPCWCTFLKMWDQMETLLVLQGKKDPLFKLDIHI
jgi:hypothetical protein